MVQISPDVTREDLAAIDRDYGALETIMDNIHQGLESLESNGVLVEG